MFNDLPAEYQHEELDRNAYNAAFYELGFRWYWDRETYEQLLRHSPSSMQRVRYYLETRQPHLLKAYDAAFLVGVIEEKQAQHRQRSNAASAAMGSASFDWSQMPGSELGA